MILHPPEFHEKPYVTSAASVPRSIRKLPVQLKTREESVEGEFDPFTADFKVLFCVKKLPTPFRGHGFKVALPSEGVNRRLASVPPLSGANSPHCLRLC